MHIPDQESAKVPFTIRAPVPSQKSVEAFKVLCLEKFGVELDNKEATDLAIRYLQFFEFGTTSPCEPGDKESSLESVFKVVI